MAKKEKPETRPRRVLYVDDVFSLSTTEDGSQVGLHFVGQERRAGAPLEQFQVVIPDHKAYEALCLLIGLAKKMNWPIQDVGSLGIRLTPEQ